MGKDMKLLLITALLFFAACTPEPGQQLPLAASGMSQTCLEGVVYYVNRTHAAAKVYTAKFLPSGKVATCGEGK